MIRTIGTLRRHPDFWRLFGTAGALISGRVLGTVLSLAMTILMARMLTPGELGTVFAAMSACVLASILATANVEIASARFVLGYLQERRIADAGGFLRLVYGLPLVTLPLVAGAVALLTLAGEVRVGWTLLAAGIAAAPFFALARAQARISLALDRVLIGALPRQLLRPAVFCMVFGAAYAAGSPVTPAFAMALFLACWVATAALQAALLRPHIADMLAAPPAFGEARSWLSVGVRSAPLLVWNDHQRDLPILAAAVVLSGGDVARLGISLSIISLLGFTLSAAEQVFVPRIARAVIRADLPSAQRQLDVLTGVRALFFAAGTPVILLILPHLLALVGKEYEVISLDFWVFLLLPLSTVTFGPVAEVLNISGHVRELMIGTLTGICALAVLTAVGASTAGLLGAGLGIVAAATLMQAILLHFCRARTGLDPSILGALRGAVTT